MPTKPPRKVYVLIRILTRTPDFPMIYIDHVHPTRRHPPQSFLNCVTKKKGLDSTTSLHISYNLLPSLSISSNDVKVAGWCYDRNLALKVVDDWLDDVFDNAGRNVWCVKLDKPVFVRGIYACDDEDAEEYVWMEIREVEATWE